MSVVTGTDPQAAPNPRVRFDLWPAVWKGCVPFLERLIDRTEARSVCDVGGGARSSCPLETVARSDLEYVLLEVSDEDLAKAPEGYANVGADVAAADFDTGRQVDLVVTSMVAGHIERPDAFHANFRRLLVPNWRAFHFFATLYALPFVVNRFLPRAIGGDILTALRPVQARGTAS